MLNLIVGGAPHVDREKPLPVDGHAEREIVAARRPDIIANLVARRLDDLGHLLVGHRHDEDLAVFVTERDPLSVSRPVRLITHGTAAGGDLRRRFRSILRHDVEFFLAAHVGNESDLRTVR